MPESIETRSPVQERTYACAWLLASLSSAALLISEMFRTGGEDFAGRPVPAIVLPLAADVLVAALLVTFASRARAYIADYFVTLETNEKLLIVMASLAFFFVPTLLFRRFSVLTGLVALHIPVLIALVSAAGFARLYLLGGLSVAIATSVLPAIAGYWVASGFGAALIITMAYDHFCWDTAGMHLRGPVSTAPPGLPLLLGLRAMAIPALAAVALTAITPLGPRLVAPQVAPPAQEVAVPPPVLSEGDFSALLMKLMLESVAVALLIVIFGTILLWYRKKRRRRPDLPPETIGVPVGTAKTDRRSRENAADYAADTPRARVIRAYLRTLNALGEATRFERLAGESAADVFLRAAKQGISPRDEFREITNAFVLARYSNRSVGVEDAAFSEGASKRMISAASARAESR